MRIGLRIRRRCLRLLRVLLGFSERRVLVFFGAMGLEGGKGLLGGVCC
jgi:hypothetical protein